MTALVWDQLGTRFYESGVDRGVLYLPSGLGVPWNGLISVTEKTSGGEGTPVYYDGVKYANAVALGDFSASIKAYTYPDEFQELEGVVEVRNGLFVSNQPVVRFGLSYRTKIGNDLDDDLGYKIHLLYNLTATPSQKAYQTIPEISTPMEFEWSVTAVPEDAPGFKPTAHLIIDTRKASPLLIADLEATLYGNEVKTATLPKISTLTGFFGDWVIIRITDNYDGTWTATGPDNLITMLDSTTFQIIQANAIYSDGDTYIISDLTY